MAKIDLANEFVAKINVAGTGQRIEEERVVVIYEFPFFYAYRSGSVESDKEIVEAFLEEVRNDTGCTDYEATHWGDLAGVEQQMLLSIPQNFEGDFDYDTYYVLAKAKAA
jgi:hypothetical protein